VSTRRGQADIWTLDLDTRKIQPAGDRRKTRSTDRPAEDFVDIVFDTSSDSATSVEPQSRTRSAVAGGS